MTSTFPIQAGDGSTIDMNATFGGIHVGGGIDVTIFNTDILANVVTPYAPSRTVRDRPRRGGSPLLMTGSRVEGNTVTTVKATAGDVGSLGSTPGSR